MELESPVCQTSCLVISRRPRKMAPNSSFSMPKNLIIAILLICILNPTYALFEIPPTWYKSRHGVAYYNGTTWQLAVKLKTNPKNISRDLLDGMANQIAEEHDLLNHGQVGELIGHYLFTRKPDELEIVLPETEVLLEQRLRRHPHVEYYSPQVLLTRQKRQFVPKGGHHSAVR